MSLLKHFEGGNSGSYNQLSERYADYWRRHVEDAAHYGHVRAALEHWYLSLRDKGIHPGEGSAVLVGPGFNVAQGRELDESLAKNHLAEHDRLVVVDFSIDVLDNSFESLCKEDSRITKIIRLVRRDITDGLSGKFDAWVRGRLGPERDSAGLSKFCQFVRDLETIDKDTLLQQIAAQEVENGGSPKGRPEVLQVTSGDGMDVREVVEGAKEVRFVIANLVLTGTAAVTEEEFRRRLMGLRKEHPEVITDQKLRKSLLVWHLLLSEFNKKIAMLVFGGVAQAHPEADMFFTVDTTSTYEGIGRYGRLDLEALRRAAMVAAKEAGVGFFEDRQWQLNDSVETPPHSHDVCVLHARVIPDLKKNPEKPEDTGKDNVPDVRQTADQSASSVEVRTTDLADVKPEQAPSAPVTGPEPLANAVEEKPKGPSAPPPVEEKLSDGSGI